MSTVDSSIYMPPPWPSIQAITGAHARRTPCPSRPRVTTDDPWRRRMRVKQEEAPGTAKSKVGTTPKTAGPMCNVQRAGSGLRQQPTERGASGGPGEAGEAGWWGWKG